MTRRRLWKEHGVVLLCYAALTLALTWPLAKNFTAAITGRGDAREHLWMLWHTKEALFGTEPLFSTSLLYYPYGTTLLTSAVGPVMGVLALPFWLWGPEAAYNGALLLGFLLTGYCMYLLARDLGFERGIALFAGVILLVAPLHLAALYAHLSKVFLGALPLALLTFHRVLDPQRSLWWAPATAGTLLLALLQSGEQFIFASLAIGFFAFVSIWSTHRAGLRVLARRIVLVVASTLVLAGPLLVRIILVTRDPNIEVGRNLESTRFQPDLVQFIVPPTFSRFTGSLFGDFLKEYSAYQSETAVFLAWTGMLLCVIGLIANYRRAGRWFLFTVVFAVLALGPNLVVMGQSLFTEYDLPVVLPYAFLTSLPGLDFMRTPGRLMFVGFVGFGITASFGLEWLKGRLPHRLAYLTVSMAIIAVLAETWPEPWPQEVLRPVPQFYQQLSRENDQYGVFDLPIRPYRKIQYASSYLVHSSYYQMYQMTHGKGIASGQIPRQFTYHPAFAHFLSNSVADSLMHADVLVDGQPTNRYANALYELARHNYRYVVYHKPQPGYPEYRAGSWGEATAQMFIEEVFSDKEPIFDDQLTTVYEVPPATEATAVSPTIALRESALQNWYEEKGGLRWAFSPATFYVASPHPQLAYVEVTPEALWNRETESAVSEGRLTIQSAAGFSNTTSIAAQSTVTLPVTLDPGSQIITLTLQTRETGGSEPDSLDLVFGRVNLKTEKALEEEANLGSDAREGETITRLLTRYATGWYNPEEWPGSSYSWRWAKSPASVYIYSHTRQEVTLKSAVGALHDPGSSDGKGNVGNLFVSLNGATPEAIETSVGESVVISLALEEGWNEVILTLEAGNFRPGDVQPGNSDFRELSFAVAEFSSEER